MKSLLVLVCCFSSWAAFASSQGVFFTDVMVDVTGGLVANDMADLTLRLELLFDKARTSATSGTDLWKAKAWISTMKGGGGPKIAFEKQILPDEVAATPIDIEVNPLVLDNLVYTVDLIGVPCSLATYVCVRFQSGNGGPSTLFRNGDGTVESKQTICEPVECMEDPCTGIYCDIPVCPPGYVVDYDGEGCCPGCIAGPPPTIDPCFNIQCGIPMCTDGFELSYEEGCCPSCVEVVDPVPPSLKPVMMNCGEYANGDSWIDRSGGDCMMMSCIEGQLVAAMPMCMMPECDNPVTEPNGCCLVCPEPEDTCSMAPVSGLCLAYFPRYFFNATSGNCEKFVYGGCGGNSNNFQTLQDCEAECVPPKPEDGEPKVMEPEGGMEGEPMDGGVMEGVPIEGEPMEGGPMEPEPMEPEGAMEAPANETEPQPEVEPEPSASEDVCLMPAEVGMCRAFMERWAYNSKAGKCEPFIYGGCGGNGNNFMTADDCVSACVDSGTETSEDPQPEPPLNKCLNVCILIYAPVCSTSGETFSNECMFEYAKCKDDPTLEIASYGECEEDVEENQESECQRRSREEEERRVIGNYIPSCDENGDFTAQQCHGSTGHCWCVDENGQEIENTRRGPIEERVDCMDKCLNVCNLIYAPVCSTSGETFSNECMFEYAKCKDDPTLEIASDGECEEDAGEDQESECQRRAREEEERRVIGNYIPTCDENGDFTAQQCHGSTGHCWCVDENGQEIENTRRGPIEERVDCMAPVNNCDGYSDGEEWMPQPCETCTCFEGSKICAMPDCLPAFCENPLVEGACCPICPEETTAPPPDCDGYGEGDTWEPQPCEMCTCVLGRKVCASPSCAVPCLAPIPGEGACCPTCPDGPLPECDNYSLGDSWSTDGGCTSCTCENFGKVCIATKCPETGCFSPQTVEGECCKQCLAPLRARVNNMHIRAKPRVWRGATPVIANLAVTIRTSSKSENVTGDGLWKISMWLDSSINGDGNRLWSMDQILSDEQAAQPLYSSENLYFEDISVRVGGSGYECPDTDHYYCLELMPSDEPSVKFTFSATGKKSLLRCIKAPCISN